MTARATAAANGAPRRRRWLRWLGGGLLLAVVLIALALVWLLGSTSGLRFALARAHGFTDGALQVRHAEGRLAGPLQLAGVRYDNGAGTTLTAAHARLDLQLWPLLAGRLHVLSLDISNVALALPAASDDNDDTTPSLQPPLDMIFDRAHVGALTITQAGQPVFAADRLDLAGRWTSDGLAVTQLAVRSPDGHVDLTGNLAIGGAYRGDGTARFAWTFDGVSYAGAVSARADGRQSRLDVALAAPAVIQLHLQLAQDGSNAWSATLDAPRFDPQPWLGDSTFTALGAKLSAQGDRDGATIQGTLDVDDYRLLLQPLRARLSADRGTLTLQQLTLGSPQIKGSVEASGVVHLDAKPRGADLRLAWNDVELPAALAGQLLATHGELALKGNLGGYHASGDIAIGPPGKSARIALDLDGSPRQLTLHTLDLVQAQGNLHAEGSLALQPSLAWQARATATHLDPGQLFAGWTGALDADLVSNGSRDAEGIDATLDIAQLRGTLRARVLRGSGKLHLSRTQVLDGTLRLASGGSTVSLDANPGASNDIRLVLAVASLGDWLPHAAGRLDGHLAVAGAVPHLSVNGQLNGSALRWQQQRVGQAHLIVGVPDISRLAGKLQLDTRDVQLQGLAFAHVGMLAEGSARDHRLNVTARGQQLSGALDLHGDLNAGSWRGTLERLDLQPQGLPAWSLRAPAPLSYRDGLVSVAEVCLSAGDPLLCVAGKRDAQGNMDARYRLRELPLALVLDAAGEGDLPVRTEGVINGAGQLHRSRAGALTGTASIESPNGSITYTDRAYAPLLRYNQLRLSAELAAGSQRFAVHGGLDAGGRIDGELSITGASQSLAGQLDLDLDSLGFVELLSGELANVKGKARGSFHFGGTRAQPLITGQATVAPFAAEVPSLGLALDRGRLQVSTTDAREFRVDGEVHSGEGSMIIAGTAGFGANATTSLSLKGSKVTAADIPAARVVISPDLTLKRDASGTDIGGAVTIDSAEIDAGKLPGGGATHASADVVVVDDTEQEQADAVAGLPVRATVNVDLGRRTHVVGMGLDGRVSGVLTVIENPGHPTTGRGQLAVTGTYRAYGQNLQIKRGQLLFASTPIDNPGLNLRAVRKLDPNATIDEGQEVGLLVSGTARRPVLTVFSDPVMEQSDALAYLVTGKPLSQVSGGEGDLVSAAAQALGSAAGNLLARRVGSRIGVDDIGVASNDALGGNSAFTVGKYLSPRLYISYGVGLFQPGTVITLRYRLSQRWNFEAQQATDASRASFNYRIEK